MPKRRNKDEVTRIEGSVSLRSRLSRSRPSQKCYDEDSRGYSLADSRGYSRGDSRGYSPASVDSRGYSLADSRANSWWGDSRDSRVSWSRSPEVLKEEVQAGPHAMI